MNHIFTFLMFSLAVAPVAAGSLTPPGAPGPTMRTLDEVEARIPIRPVDLPIDISEPGSYYLTGNATLGEGDGAIDILVSNVVIDLNGFTLRGPGLDAPGGGGDGQGIHCLDAATTSVIVRNGTVTDWPAIGIDLHGHESVVENINAVNCSFGINIRNGDVRNCRASYNQYAGISIKTGITNGRGTISNCVVSHNVGDGIAAFSASNCFVVNNHCFENGGFGINVDAKSIVKDNLSVSNGADGIRTGEHCTIENNQCDGNGKQGIRTLQSVVKNNSCSNNVTDGIYAEQSCRVEENHVSNNTGHGLVGVSNSICVKNTSNSNGGSEFVSSGGGIFSTIVTLTAGTPIPAGTDAWANFAN